MTDKLRKEKMKPLERPLRDNRMNVGIQWPWVGINIINTVAGKQQRLKIDDDQREQHTSAICVTVIDKRMRQWLTLEIFPNYFI